MNNKDCIAEIRQGIPRVELRPANRKKLNPHI
jgi:hypothetical protein